MRKTLLVLTVLATTMALLADVFAQGMGGGGGWGRHGQYQRLYDPKTVETFSGEVVEIGYFSPMRGMGQGVHLQLKAEKETISVHLGPKWFLDNQEVQIKKGDRINVKGSRITIDEKPALIAAEVERGNETLILRDSDGLPLWAGWRRKGN